MKSVFAAIALFVSLAVADSFQINTPANVDECEPTLLSWTGGNPPYYVSILPGASPDGTAIESFPATNATSITWQVNIQAQTSIGFTLRDSSGNIAQTAAITVQSGNSNSCLSSTSYTVGGTSGSSGASSTAGGASASQTSAGATTAASSASSSASATSSSTSSSGASINAAQLGAAAMVSVALGALFF